MYNTYDYAAEGFLVGGIFGGLMVVVVIFSIIALVLSILNIIGYWKILKKANKPGWASLIPFYGQYLLCKISGVNPWWILIVFLSPLSNLIPILGSALYFAITIYFLVLLNVSLARSYGKETGFAIGMILLQPIFYFILGKNDIAYLGPRPMDDIIFKNNSDANNDFNSNSQQSYNQNQPVQPTNMTNMFCPNCGSKESGNFCTKCGKQIR